MKLSDNLKTIRKENNLSQEQLAEKLGVSRQAVSKWESGQSYPEMDKVLLICKLFNYNIDELMNENVKEVNETKQSKININKYIDDFFAFITKTVDMLSSMKFRQKFKCFVEQIGIIIFLVCIFAIIGGIGSSILNGLIGGLPSKIYYCIRNIISSIYIILALIVGTTVLLHIFKIRYLDYYEIIKENDLNESNESNNNAENKIQEQTDNNEKKKIFIEKKKEKIIIRDPEHSQSKFLTGIIRVVLWCIKFIAAWIALGFVATFVCLFTLLILSFLFVKTGLVFLGSLLGIISAIIINFVILELLYNFIVSKKSKKSRMAILFVISLVLAGISIGMILIGITNFNYIEDVNINNGIEDVYNIQMTENLSISGWGSVIEFIENDSSDVKIVIKHSKYYKTKIYNENETIELYCFQDDSKIMEAIRDTIKDINNKEIKDYYNPTIYVYASKDNIEKMKKNQESKYEKIRESELNELYEKTEEWQNRVYELNEIIDEKDSIIEDLNRQLEEIRNIQTD